MRPANQRHPTGSEPLCSTRVVQPFIRILRGSSAIPVEWIEFLQALEVNDRLPVSIAHQLLDGFVELTGNPYIGLKAAREWSAGDGGALDHAFTTASTVREAIDTAARYMPLVTDTLELRLVTAGNDAFLRLEHPVGPSCAAQDFESGAIFRAFRCIWAAGPGESLRVLMSRSPPRDATEYARTFDATPVDFDAPFSGFMFDAACLDARLTSADFELHEAICQQANLRLQELSRAHRFSERVRCVLATELRVGSPGIDHIASRLHMSARTLERKLDREGITFSALLQDLRRELAVRYVTIESLQLKEIPSLLGYSNVACFHRAFKRWTGETPIRYRRGNRSAA